MVCVVKKNNSRTLSDLLASKEFLLWLCGAWTLFYVASAIWMNEAFAYFINGIGHNLLMQIPFVLFLISGFLNIIRVSKALLKKGRLALLMWVLLPAGAVIFLTGFFLSINLRKAELHLAGEGDIIRHGLSSDVLDVVSMSSGLEESFWDFDAGKGIFAYEPKLTVKNGSSRPVVIGAYPPAKINNIYYHILNFGIAPGIVLYEGADKKKEGHMPLRILQPGSTDEFELSPYPYRFVISMVPVKVVQKQRPRAAMFNMRDPVYNVKVYKDGNVIAEADSKESIRFDGLSLSFYEPSCWARIEIVRDPALPVLLIGMLLGITGLPLYLMRFLLKLRSGELKRTNNM